MLAPVLSGRGFSSPAVRGEVDLGCTHDYAHVVRSVSLGIIDVIDIIVLKRGNN